MFDPIDQLPEKDLRAVGDEARVVWDNGDIRLTTEAVVLAADTDRPDVIPLDSIYEVRVEYGCLVLCATGRDVWSSVLDDPEELAALVREEARKAHLSHPSVGS